MEPLSLQEAREHLSDPPEEDNGQINSLITAGREEAEFVTGRALITQGISMSFDEFGAEMLLPRPPLQSVTAVKYLDADGNQQTVNQSVYQVGTNTTPGRILLLPGQVWPETMDIPGAITVEFVAGYGDDADSVPEIIRQGIRLFLTKHYDLEQSDGAYLDDAIKSSFFRKKVVGV
ncbi:MAG: hypothetical protein JAY88_14705 [Candidatus Thiodiazotropha lotti]|nr:hypothetical protein [Candidatus Thiodiazotropha lotti]MCW4188314.1 hypothetical protein [Candidatus Thiodiazotropha lotti]